MRQHGSSLTAEVPSLRDPAGDRRVPYMPGHSNIRFMSGHAPNAHSTSVTSGDAAVPITCGHCGREVLAAVIADVHSESPEVRWLRCPSCGRGLVLNAGNVMSPSAPAGEMVEGLPPETEAAYAEARGAMGVGAYTAGELMCRKILMHVAVDKGAGGNKSFAHYIDYLTSKGYITPPMKPWVDQIRKNGNESTHEIPPADKDRALGTLAFTTQMLRLVYEMQHKVAQYIAPPTPTA